jgi:hypothetical protein
MDWPCSITHQFDAGAAWESLALEASKAMNVVNIYLEIKTNGVSVVIGYMIMIRNNAL